MNIPNSDSIYFFVQISLSNVEYEEEPNNSLKLSVPCIFFSICLAIQFVRPPLNEYFVHRSDLKCHCNEHISPNSVPP